MKGWGLWGHRMENPRGLRKYMLELTRIGAEGRAIQSQFKWDLSWHVWDYKHFIFMELLRLYDAKTLCTQSPLTGGSCGKVEGNGLGGRSGLAT